MIEVWRPSSPYGIRIHKSDRLAIHPCASQTSVPASFAAVVFIGGTSFCTAARLHTTLDSEEIAILRLDGDVPRQFRVRPGCEAHREYFFLDRASWHDIRTENSGLCPPLR